MLPGAAVMRFPANGADGKLTRTIRRKAARIGQRRRSRRRAGRRARGKQSEGSGKAPQRKSLRRLCLSSRKASVQAARARSVPGISRLISRNETLSRCWISISTLSGSMSTCLAIAAMTSRWISATSSGEAPERRSCVSRICRRSRATVPVQQPSHARRARC